MVASCCIFYWEAVVDIVNQYISPRDPREQNHIVKTQIKIHGCSAVTLMFDCLFVCLLGNQEHRYTKHLCYIGSVCSPRPLGIKEVWFTQERSVFLYQQCDFCTNHLLFSLKRQNYLECNGV